jgi:hypothetical protein
VDRSRGPERDLSTEVHETAAAGEREGTRLADQARDDPASWGGDALPPHGAGSVTLFET